MNTEQKEVSMENVNYETEVRKVYYASRIIKIGVDDGHSTHPMYCVFKSRSTLKNDAIGSPVKHRKHAWRSAYETLKS